MKQIIVLSFLFLFLTNCKQKQFFSEDFTLEGSFTEGIEGPATDNQGNIYAVNFQEQGTIGMVSSDGHAELFVKLPDGSIGNGIRFGHSTQMFVADYTNHNILEIDIMTKQVKVFAHQSEANQPNDIAISSKHTIFASDPNWSDNTGNLWKVTKENGFELLEGNMGTTNGIEVSNDDSKLYVNESVQRKVWVYDLDEHGNVSNKREFISFEDHGLDGMRCDDRDNLYICRYGKGTIAVVSPNGILLREIKLKGMKPSNITFSNDYRRCYVTMADRGCLETVKLK